MKSGSLEQKLFQKIKEQGIDPKPRWVFVVKNCLLWAGVAVFLVLEGLAVSVIIYILRYSDWSVYKQAADGWSEFLFLSLPIFWIAVSAVVGFALFYNLRYTGKGYRYPVYVFVVAVVVIGLFLGGTLFQLGIGRAIDNVLGARIPYYGQIINPRISFWCQPAEGRLTGVVVSKTDMSNFVLCGCDGVDWKVEFVKRQLEQGMHKQPSIRFVREGDYIKAVGEAVSGNEFRAHDVSPVHSGRMFLQHYYCGNCPVFP